MQCFTEKIAIFAKEKTLKLNNYGSYFKVYSHGCPWQTRTVDTAVNSRMLYRLS